MFQNDFAKTQRRLVGGSEFYFSTWKSIDRS